MRFIEGSQVVVNIVLKLLYTSPPWAAIGLLLLMLVTLAKNSNHFPGIKQAFLL